MLLVKEYPIEQKPGIYEDVPFEEYSKWNAFSKSMTYPALKSALHLRSYIENDRKTQALKFGSLVDCMLLEPQLFNEQFVIQPLTYEKVSYKGRGDNKERIVEDKPWNNNSNTCKHFRESVEKQNKILIKTEDYNQADACRDAVLENEIAKEVVEQGKKQVSIVWECPETGILCKGRFDILHDKYIWDLKTTIDASPDGFSRAIAKNLYHVQAGAYTEGYQILTGESLTFGFIAVEKTEGLIKPCVGLYEMLYNDESMIAGRSMFHRACRLANGYGDDLTGYSKFPEPISIPYWAIQAEMDIEDDYEVDADEW